MTAANAGYFFIRANITNLLFQQLAALDTFNTISCLQTGDEFVFRTVFFEYQDRIYAYVLKKTQSDYIAEETLQLTFIKLWKYRHALREDIPLLSQLFRIARTTMIDVLRSQHNRAVLPDPDQYKALQINDVSEKTEARELQQKLAGLLSQMPGMQKKVFEMNRFEGMSYRDIAMQLSISVRTVETHIARSLKFLRKHLTLFVFLSLVIR